MTEKKLLPSGVLNQIKKEKKIILKRVWHDDLSSNILLSGDQVDKLFLNHEQAVAQKEEKINEKLDQLIDKKNRAGLDFRHADEEMHAAEQKLEEAKTLVSELSRSLRQAKKTEQKNQISGQLEKAKKNLGQLKSEYEKKKKLAGEKSVVFEQATKKARYAVQSREAAEEMLAAEGQMRVAGDQVRKLQQLFINAYSEKERHGITLELDGANERYLKAIQIYEQARERAVLRKYLAFKILLSLYLDLSIASLEDAFCSISSNSRYKFFI